MKAAFEEVMKIRGAGLPGDGQVTLSGADPVFSTRFKIGETCAAVLAGVGVAVPPAITVVPSRITPHHGGNILAGRQASRDTASL